jgi:tetratricopeptide (TPR) repeat protein
VLLAAQLRQAESDAVDAEALEAFNRALELDPQLGEAWIERARFTSDPSKANELFHKAIDLAPNYAMGYVRFSQFLSDHYRRGEAIDMIDRALRIDPLSPQLKFRAHVLLMLARTDFVGAEQQLREALAINPNFHPALENLGEIRCGFAGECADGLRLLERSIALDADSDSSKAAAATAYLEVDDPNAALAVVHDARQRTAALVQIAQYQHDGKRAAELARGASDNEWLTGKEELAEAVRDGAIATGDFRSALSILESQYERSGALSREFVASDAFLGLMYAHTLTFAGEIARGRKLAASLLVKLDTEAVGRTPYALSRPRAAAYAILGDDERALDMLENCLKMPYLTRWWYLSELDPLYQHLHQNPRFQAFAERARQHRLAQRKLVDEMRRKGELPNRILGEPVMGEPGTAAKQTK